MASISSPQIKRLHFPAEVVLSLYLAATRITLFSKDHTELPHPQALAALVLPAFSQDAEGIFPILTLDTVLLVLQTRQIPMPTQIPDLHSVTFASAPPESTFPDFVLLYEILTVNGQ